jgi:GT2 family glycosyltransferase
MRVADLIIPAYGNPEGLQLTLQSIFKQHFHKETKLNVLVCDDASPSPLAEQLPKNITNRIQIIRKKNNSGRAAARNQGVIVGNATYLFFLDSDCFYDNKYALEKHLSYLEQGHEVSLGTTNARGENFWSLYQQKVHKQRLNAAISGNYLALTTANFAITRKCFELIGGFNTAYKHYGFEDRDFIARLVKKKVGIKFASDVTAWHHDRISMKKICIKMNEAARYSAPIFYHDHPELYLKMPYSKIDIRLSTLKNIGPFIHWFQLLNHPLAILGDYIVSKQNIPSRWKEKTVKTISGWCYMTGSIK